MDEDKAGQKEARIRALVAALVALYPVASMDKEKALALAAGMPDEVCDKLADVADMLEARGEPEFAEAFSADEMKDLAHFVVGIVTRLARLDARWTRERTATLNAQEADTQRATGE